MNALILEPNIIERSGEDKSELKLYVRRQPSWCISNLNHTHIHTHIYTTYIHNYTTHIHIYRDTHNYTTHTHLYNKTYKSTHTHTHTHIYTTYTHNYTTHIHIYTAKHTNLHTHTNTHRVIAWPLYNITSSINMFTRETGINKRPNKQRWLDKLSDEVLNLQNINKLCTNAIKQQLALLSYSMSPSYMIYI